MQRKTYPLEVLRTRVDGNAFTRFVAIEDNTRLQERLLKVVLVYCAAIDTKIQKHLGDFAECSTIDGLAIALAKNLEQSKATSC